MKEGIHSMHFGYLFFIYSEICKRDENKEDQKIKISKCGLLSIIETNIGA